MITVTIILLIIKWIRQNLTDAEIVERLRKRGWMVSSPRN